jgi:hypothetical protein
VTVYYYNFLDIDVYFEWQNIHIDIETIILSVYEKENSE